jgi:hypothetical protein
MNKKNFIKLARLIAKFAEVSTDKGVLIYDGELAEGIEVVNEDGENPEDGEYALEDGTILVVSEGKVSEIKKAEDPANEEVKEEPIKEEAEPEPAEEPIVPDEKDALISELQAKLAEYKAYIAELENKIKELEDKAEAPKEDAVSLAAVAQPKSYKNNGALKYFQN